MEALVAVLGTLLGGVLGAAGTHFNQRSAQKHASDERLASLRRVAYLDFLSAVHEMFELVGAIHRDQRSGVVGTEEASLRLRAVPSGSGQRALEDVRLVASSDVAATAADLWARMRREPAPTGSQPSWSQFVEWRPRYWTARREFIDAARHDIGLRGLDWSSAAVS